MNAPYGSSAAHNATASAMHGAHHFTARQIVVGVLHE